MKVFSTGEFTAMMELYLGILQGGDLRRENHSMKIFCRGFSMEGRIGVPVIIWKLLVIQKNLVQLKVRSSTKT